MSNVREFLRKVMGAPREQVTPDRVAKDLDAHLVTAEHDKQEFQEDLDNLQTRVRAIELQLGLVSRGEFDATSPIPESGPGGVDSVLLPGTYGKHSGCNPSSW